jgi:[ribosomal protein S18]-alanine N-acetyltransferase
MGLTYFKRYRMEIDLQRKQFVLPELPPGYVACPWEESRLEAHAEAKYRAFAQEIDAFVFPSLSSREGCLKLMREITGRREFVPETTWLLLFQGSPCGTIQGIRIADNAGSVQNVGVVPEHRGLGLGTYLLGQALAGFQQAGIRRVSLEVTSRNQAAHRLYRRLGFLRIRTVYKTAEVAYA